MARAPDCCASDLPRRYSLLWKDLFPEKEEESFRANWRLLEGSINETFSGEKLLMVFDGIDEVRSSHSRPMAGCFCGSV